MDAALTLTSRTGRVRLRLEFLTGHTLTVGPFATLGGARRMAEDLIAEGTVLSVAVSHRNKGSWRPAWSFSVGGRA
jgi:hypothetical protein